MAKLRCPICKQERELERDSPTFPFCSSRCREIDLANWLGEAYRFSRPASPGDVSDDEIELN